MYKRSGLGDTTVTGPDGLPISIPDSTSSLTLDYSQGYASAPGGPGSSAPGGIVSAGSGPMWEFPVLSVPSSSPNYTAMLFGVGALALIFLMGGRR